MSKLSELQRQVIENKRSTQSGGQASSLTQLQRQVVERQRAGGDTTPAPSLRRTVQEELASGRNPLLPGSQSSRTRRAQEPDRTRDTAPMGEVREERENRRQAGDYGPAHDVDATTRSAPKVQAARREAEAREAQTRLDGLNAQIRDLQRQGAGSFTTSGRSAAEARTRQIRTLQEQADTLRQQLEEKRQEATFTPEAMRRWEELAGKPGPLTDEEKAEAEAAIRALSGSTLGNIGKGVATLLGGDGYTEEDARRRNLAEQLKVRASAVPGFIVGMGDAIPFVGRAVEQGLDRTGQVPREAWATENYLPEGYNPMRDVPREHPAAYTVGSGVMDLTQILGMSGAIEGATGAIKGFSKLPRALQGAINSIGTFGTLGALREAGEGGSAADVAKAGLIQGAGAAVGSGMGSLVSGGMTRGLFRAGLQNSVAANILRDALAGSAFAGGDMAARALLDSDYRPTSEEAVKDLAVAFAFSAITSSLRSIRATGEAKARLERDVDAMKRDYASIVDGAGGQVTEQALDDLAARSARVRETMGRTQYVGQQATVAGIYEFLDTLDDSIARARGNTGGSAAFGGLPGASGGALAPVGGGSPPAGGFSTPSSGGGPTMAGAAGARAFSGPLDGLGEHGQKAFSAVYDGQSNPAAFYAGFVRAYNAGKAGKPLAEQPVQGYNEGQENTLSEAQRFAAYSAGENDRKAGEGLTPQSATRTAPLVGEPEQAGGFQHGGQVPDGGGERGPGVGSGGQAGILAEGAGRDQGRDVQGRRAAQRRAESQALGGVGQSAAGLGIPGGTERESVRVIPERLYDEELSGVAAEQAQAGRKVVFTVGALEVEGADGAVSTARGASYGDTLYIQADHERYTATQLADHESFHDRVRREPALRQRVADAVLEKYGGPELDGLLDYYAQVYAGVYGGEIGEAAFEELLADAYAGINVFAGADTLGEGAAKYTGTVRGAAGSMDTLNIQEVRKDGQGREAGSGGLPGTAGEDAARSESLERIHGKGGEVGRRLVEDRSSFLGRGRPGVFEVAEIGRIGYGYRPVQGGLLSETAGAVREELSALDIDSFIHGDHLEVNFKGETLEMTGEAVALEKKIVGISDGISLAPRNVAGHEASHIWYATPEGKVYSETILANVEFSDPAYLSFAQKIADRYFPEGFDLADKRQASKFFDELVAYISGDIHEGGHEDRLAFLRDYGEVRAAWEKLRGAAGGMDTTDIQEVRRHGGEERKGLGGHDTGGAGAEVLGDAGAGEPAQAADRGRDESLHGFLGKSRPGVFETVKVRKTAYGYRPVLVEKQSEIATSVISELSNLGLNGFVFTGDMEINRGGRTELVKGDAVTLLDGTVAVRNDADISPRSIAGHEMFHARMRAENPAAFQYFALLVDDIDYSNREFQAYASEIERLYFPGGVDLSRPNHYYKFFNELAAYISGDLYEGIRLEENASIFRNWSAVVAAWEKMRDDIDSPKLSRESDLERQVERLARRNEALREQFRVSQGARTSRKGVTGLASTVLDEYSSGYDREELEKRLLHLYDFIANGRDAAGNELSYGAAKTEAVGIARDILDGARVLDDELYRQYKDLRDFLRGSKLVLNPADRGDLDMAGGYEAFKKANFGRFTLGAAGTPVDTVYRELAGRWPEFFPEDITHPADQLMQMADTLDGLQPVYENPYNYNLNEAVEELADDLLERFFEVPQEPPTFADKAQRRLTEQKIHDDKKLERLRSEKNALIAQEREAGRERVRQAVQRERERREKKVSALKTHYAEVNQRRRARAGESKARSRLLNVARRLDRMKATPQNRAVIQGLIGDLDLVSKGITGQTVENLRALRDWYEGLSDKESDHYDPDFLPDTAVEKALSRLGKKHIAEMDMEAVRELTETLLSIEHELRTERKLLATEEKRDIYHLAGEAIGDIRASGGKRAGTPVDAYNTLSLSPLREFRRLVGYREESPFYRLAVGLNDGQRRMLDFQMRASKLFDELVRDKAEMQRFTGKKAEEIQVTGLGRSGIVTVPITPAMRVALCLHARNPANLRHIQRGGVTIPDMKLYRQGKIREAYAKGETVKLSPSSVRSIVAGMTEKERAFANKADRFFNGMCKEAINGTSLVLNGYEKATVEHYFPIKTDPDFTRVDFEALVRDGTIEGMGMLKERTPGAVTPILLEDVTQVLRRQIDNVSRYGGLAVPVRNFNKVWNLTLKENADSVKKALGQVWGVNAKKYIENLMTDLQNGRQTDQSRLDRLRGNFAQAVLAVNVSVTMKQAASYPTAAGVLGWRPLMRAFADGGRVNRDLVAKYTPLLWFREQGGSTTELGDVARRQGWADKLPALMGWIQKADVITVAKLWKASGYYVREHNKALQVGSEAYYREVAEVFNRVVEETQPNYTVMQRPDVLRTPNHGLRALTMFSTQRMQNYNMLYDAVGEWRAREEQYAHAPGEETRKARDEARKKLARNISAQLVAAATIAAMTLLSSVLLGRMRKYKNEEGEVTLESALAGLGEDFVGTLMGSALFGSDVYNAVMAVFGNRDWYDIENPSVTLINDMVTAAKSFWKAVEAVKDGEADAKKLWLKFNDLAVAASKFMGVPLENMEKMAGGVGQFISRLIYGPLLGEYYYLAVSSDTSVSYVKGELYDLLFRAKNQDQKAYREMYEDMVGRGFKPESIKSAMDSRLKDSADFTRRQGEVEDKITEALEASRGYRQLPEAYREGALEDAAAYAAVTAKGELSDYEIPKTYAWVEKADGGKAVGLEPWEYILYRAALDMYNEGPVSITQDEAEAAIESLPGLNDEERAYLWQSTNKGWKEESNPWG